MRRVQDLAWPGQLLVAASALALAVLLVAVALGIATQLFLVPIVTPYDEPVGLEAVEVTEPSPVLSED